MNIEIEVQNLRDQVKALARRVAQMEAARSVATDPARVQPERIIAAVCEHFMISRRWIFDHARWSSLIWPRHLAVLLTFEVVKWSQADLARYFMRDHSAINYALGSARNRIKTEKPAARDYEAIRAVLAEPEP